MNDQFVVVEKMELLPDEELMSFVDKVLETVGEFRTKSDRKARLIGIFDDHIIVKDDSDGKCFKMNMKRGSNGLVEVDGTLVEVQQKFVEVEKDKEKDDDKKSDGKDKQEPVSVQCSSCEYKGKGEVGGKCPQCGAKLAASTEEGAEGAKDKEPQEDKEGEKTEKRAKPHHKIVQISKSKDSLWKGVLF